MVYQWLCSAWCGVSVVYHGVPVVDSQWSGHPRRLYLHTKTHAQESGLEVGEGTSLLVTKWTGGEPSILISDLLVGTRSSTARTNERATGGK